MVVKNKTLKLVVCMSLIVALAISALSLSVRATFENTHSNTGNQASDIVSIARTQVGYGENYEGYTKYGDWYGLPYSDWCAMFVSWCGNQAGVGTDAFPSFALCSAGADWFINQGRFHYAGSYQPQPGDLIFYASGGDIYHVGLVVDSDDYNVYSIEGNYNEAVCDVHYPLTYGDIFGYATPAYNTVGAVTPDPEPVVNYDDDDEEEEVAAPVADDETEDDDEYEVDEIADDDEEEEVSSKAVTSVDPVNVTSIKGDVNCDGVVDSTDALFIQRYLAGKLDSTNFSFLNADVDGSGEIDIADALLALEMSVA
jgi:hypothetical protein